MNDTRLVTVIERIPLRPEFASVEGAVIAGQAYDDAAGPNAHSHPGHAGHASFFFEPGPGEDSGNLVLIYPWFGRSAVAALVESESPLLARWCGTYALGPRNVHVLTEVAVDTEHDA
jgi:hypothetical protein